MGREGRSVARGAKEEKGRVGREDTQFEGLFKDRVS